MLKSSAPSRGLIVLGILATVAVPVATLPAYGPHTAAVLYYVAFCLCQALTVVAVRRIPRAARGPWNLMLVTGGFWAAGETYALYAALRGIEAYPTPADFAYILGYVALAITVLRLDRENSAGVRAGALLDALIVTLSVGVLTVVFLILPLLTDSSQSMLTRLVSSAYPLVDVMLVYLVVRLLSSGRGKVRRSAVVWLATAELATLVADTGMNLSSLVNGGDSYPRILNLFWLLFYLFVGFAAIAARGRVRPSPRPAGSTARQGLDLTVPRLVLLALAAMLPSLVIVLRSWVSSGHGYAELGGGSALLISLVVVRVWGLIQQLRRQAVQLDVLAATDPLTQVANRRSWDAELDRRLTVGASGSGVVLVALLDLDHFKRFNDSNGHHAGDALLRTVAAAWQQTLGPDGVLARWGGEEFAVVLQAEDETSGLAVLDRLRQVVPDGQTVSIGAARWNPGMSCEALMRRADVALYEAKAAGRDRLCVDASPVPPAVPSAVPPIPVQGTGGHRVRV